MKRSIFLTAILVIALSLSDALAQSPTVQYALSKLHERGFVKNGALLQEDFIEQCVLGNTENVKRFILAGADPNAVGHRGRPALLTIVDQNYTTVREDHEVVLDALISSGANLEVRDDIGRTAFVIATLRKNIGLLEAVEGTGGAIGNPKTPLHNAAMQTAGPFRPPLIARSLRRL